MQFNIKLIKIIVKMKFEILNFLEETKQEIIDNFLQDNCEKVVQYEPYGDTEVNAGYDWCDEDYADAEDYADQIIKESFEEFSNSKSVDFIGVIERAKQTLDKI